ncbi:Dimethylallyltranstransferase [Arthrobotrys entomopaga]|nr:Dimethylallyltranstransferase [Arthrobotrys entomopaga]
MLYGMGVHLSPAEIKVAHDLMRPLLLSLCLTNDYYSFDEEYREFLQSEGKKMGANAVYFYMEWEGMDIETAKRATLKRIIEFEQEALKVREEFIKVCKPEQAKVLRYMEQYWYVGAANTLWSMNCPRYHPKYRPQGKSEKIGKEKSKSSTGTNEVLTTRGSRWIRRLLVKLFKPWKNTQTTSGYRKDQSQDQVPPSPTRINGHVTSNSSSITSSKDCKQQTLPSSVSSVASNRPSQVKQETTVSLGDELLLAPYDYLTSIPSKGVRETFVDALDLFYTLPAETLTQIKSIGRILHTASIMLDDMEDNSPLRRGKDAAHIVYGTPQTINSSNYLIVWAMNEVSKLGNSTCLSVLFEELRNSLIGQSFEMKWRDDVTCPTEEQYIDMIEKSFCEDLDEGKFSYLILHAWNSKNGNRLQELFKSRSKVGTMTREEKLEVLDILRQSGSFEHTERKMDYLHAQLESEIKRFEEAVGLQNWSLRYMLYKLSKRT